mgnify:CR=1 FL=1
MLFHPAQLGLAHLDKATLEADKKACKKIGPCGVGKKALYLNSFYIDRRYYLPYGSISRVFKRVAMSQGGFSGKGMFASMAYLVVEYDGGKQKQCNFKDERDVDALLEVLAKEQPNIPRLSAAGEAEIARQKAEKAARRLPQLSKEAEQSVGQLKRASDYLARKPELAKELSAAERRKRAQLQSKPVYKYVALIISLFGVVSAAYGIQSIINHTGNYGIYFALFGFAAIFLFSSYNMMPTAHNNHNAIMKRADRAEAAMAEYIKAYPGGNFPVPDIYASLSRRELPGAGHLRSPCGAQADDRRSSGGPGRHPARSSRGCEEPPQRGQRRRSGRAGRVRRDRPDQGHVPQPRLSVTK